MDVSALATGVGIVSQVFSIFKSAKDLLPADRKEEVAKLIEQAEKEFRIFEATAASGLGYVICRQHWPPEIMLEMPGRHVCHRCPKCGATVDASGDISEYDIFP